MVQLYDEIGSKFGENFWEENQIWSEISQQLIVVGWNTKKAEMVVHKKGLYTQCVPLRRVTRTPVEGHNRIRRRPQNRIGSHQHTNSKDTRRIRNEVEWFEIQTRLGGLQIEKCGQNQVGRAERDRWKSEEKRIIEAEAIKREKGKNFKFEHALK